MTWYLLTGIGLRDRTGHRRRAARLAQGSPFIGLVIATLIVGAATNQVPFSEVPAETAAAFGETMVGVDIPTLMAAVIGKTMMESGAAERIAGPSSR